MKIPIDKHPTDLDSAVQTILDGLTPEELEVLNSKSEQDLTAMLHFGVGMYLRNCWNLWDNEKQVLLRDWFNARGIEHPDDMTGIIFTSLWRKVHDQEVNLDDQIAGYQKYWLEMKNSTELTLTKS